MLLKWLLCVAVFIFSPVRLFSENVSRKKRSDDFIPCDKGWFLFREKCFKVGGRLSWEKAAERCSEFGGNLASIQSKEELDFLVAFLLLDIRKNVWIGLHDRVNESDYTWDDGSVVNFTNWKDGEPSGQHNENEDCVEMLFEPDKDVVGQWNDITCGHEIEYICQRRIDDRKKSLNPQYCSFEEGGGWKFHNSCYQVVTEMKTWPDAEQHCKDHFSGHLATILDMTADLYLDHILSDIKKELWIGIKMKDQHQQKWMSGWHVSYNGLSKNHGDFITETCVLRKGRKVWTTVPCSKRYSFICERSKDTPPVLKIPVNGSYCPEVPEDWQDLEGEFCYFVETKKYVNWYESNFDCKRRGGNLLSIHSKEESAILNPFIKYTQTKIYIGLLRISNHEGTFVWSDDSLMDFTNWRGGEPNNKEEKCGEVWSKHMEWNDVNCEEKKGYICSVRKVTPNVTIEERPESECTGQASYKVLLGVSVCILLVIILLGVVVYCFRTRNMKRRKSSTAVAIAQMSSSSNRLKYRSQTEVHVKEDDPNYESMY